MVFGKKNPTIIGFQLKSFKKSFKENHTKIKNEKSPMYKIPQKFSSLKIIILVINNCLSR
jgi:hypothetical protein